jgi:hypothetical protein
MLDYIGNTKIRCNIGNDSAFESVPEETKDRGNLMFKGTLKQAEVRIVGSGASHMLSGVSRIQSKGNLSF